MKWIRQIKAWQFWLGVVVGVISTLLVCYQIQKPLSGLLVYAKNSPGTAVYSINSKGLDAKVLTRDFPIEKVSSPVWSPDGEQIAFGCSTYQWANLCIIKKNGIVTNEDRPVPVLEIPTKLIDMEKLPPGTCAEVSGEKGVYVNSVSWAPDGKRLAFTCGLEEDSVCTIDLAGNVECWLVSSSVEIDGVYNTTVTWSPRAEQLAISFKDFWTYKIYLVSPDGQNARFLIEGNGPGWSQDGNRLAFFRDEEIYLINQDSSGLKRIYYNPPIPVKENRIEWIEWTGSNLYFPRTDRSNRIVWSPDGGHIAFPASRTPTGGDPGIYIMSIVTGKITRLTLPDGLYEAVDWSR